MSNVVLTRQGSAPATPTTNKSRVYINSGGTLSSVDDAGVVTTYGAGITQEQVEDYVGALIQDSSEIDFTYNDAGNSLTAALTTTGVSAATYGSTTAVGSFTVDTKGRITSASNVTITPANIGAQPVDGDLTAIAALVATGFSTRTGTNTWTTRTMTAGTGITVTNGDGVSGNPTFAISNTAVTASTYGSASQVPVFTVNAQGQITGVTNTAVSVTSSAVTDFTEAAQDAVGGILTDTASIDFTYNDAGNSITAAVLPAGVDHNSLQNYVANRHIDHSAVSITAGTYLSGGGDITATRTINHANSAVTPASYGGVNAIPVITVGATGHVDAASTVNTTSALLTGLSAVLGGDTILATDTILEAFNKLVGQSNNWKNELCTTTPYTNASSTTGVNISDFSISCVAGRRYYYEAVLIYQTPATTTGIAVTCTSPDTFSGPGALLVNATTGGDGTASLYSGTINVLGDYVTTTGVQTANTPFVMHIKGNFPCSVSGTLNLTFRSEVNGSTVTVLPGSTLLVREFP